MYLPTQTMLISDYITPVIVSARNEPIALAAVSRICGIGGINGGHGDESGSTSNWFIDNTYGYINGVWEYNEGSGRFEWKLPYAKSGTSKIGVFEKFSIYNLQGAIGFGSNGNNIVGLKGVADFGTATGMLGVWGEALALKSSLGIGFYKGEFTYKAGASVLVGGGIYIRVKFW